MLNCAQLISFSFLNLYISFDCKAVHLPLSPYTSLIFLFAFFPSIGPLNISVSQSFILNPLHGTLYMSDP